MFKRILMAALVAAPLMLVPAHVDAQQRGSDRAATRGQAAAQAAQNNRPSQAPEGLRKAFEGRTPPAALQRRFPDLAPQPGPAVEPEPAPAPAPEPPAEDCPTSMSITPDGQFVEVDCHGNVVGME